MSIMVRQDDPKPVDVSGFYGTVLSSSYFVTADPELVGYRRDENGGLIDNFALLLNKRSRYNSSDTISQTTLAASRYLATTTSGTNMSRIPLTLNRWAGFASRLVSSPSAASIKSGVVNSIGVYNRAVVYGTRELAGAGNPHYNYHYTTFTIDHLIMGYGYSGSGDRLAYADPVAGRWTNTGQSKAPQKTNAMRNTSMRIFTQPWGVVL